MAPRLIAIVGPTAAGKSDLALAVASRLDAEIVSVDSRQVFRRMDVGTAKPDAAARARVTHHLLDVAEADEPYDAARYAREARAAIASILERGRRVLLCGGSGLYLRALSEGLCPAPPADADIRARLLRARESGEIDLHDALRAVDPISAERLSPRDTPRLLRALEVAEKSGRPLSAWQAEHRFADRPYELLTFVLSPSVAALDARIAARTRAMWDAGLASETAALLARGFAPDLAPLRSIGYDAAQAFLRGEIDAEEAVARTILATRRYAKRQRTWFRALAAAIWLEPSDTMVENVVARATPFVSEDRDASHLP